MLIPTNCWAAGALSGVTNTLFSSTASSTLLSTALETTIPVPSTKSLTEVPDPGSPLGPCAPVSPLSPFSPFGIPKVNANSLAVSGPDATTLTVAEEPAAKVLALAVGSAKPAESPGSPLGPWGPSTNISPSSIQLGAFSFSYTFPNTYTFFACLFLFRWY